MGTDTALVPFVRENRANPGAGECVVFPELLRASPRLEGGKYPAVSIQVGSHLSALSWSNKKARWANTGLFMQIMIGATWALRHQGNSHSPEKFHNCALHQWFTPNRG
jgi:hypothetical protein